MAGVPLARFIARRLKEEDRASLRRSAAVVSKRPLYVHGNVEVKDCDLETIGQISRGLSQSVPLRLIVVDDLMYLRPVQLWTQTRLRSARKAIGVFFKGLAEELQATVLVCSGLDPCPERESHLPITSDLRGFGLPLHYCSTVALTHQEYYFRRDIAALEYQADIFVEKSPSGRTGRLRMGWNPKNAQFDEAELPLADGGLGQNG
jgi:replicative DNA helicase